MSTDLKSMQDKPPLEIPNSTEGLINRVLELRQLLTARRQEWTTFEAESKYEIELCENRLMQIAESVGTDSLKCAAGTAYKQTAKTYRVGNWDEIIEFIKKTGNFQMLERRIGKLATAEIHEATKQVPPGVEYFEEVEMVVRKAPKRG